MKQIGILATATLICGGLSFVLNNHYLGIVAVVSFLGLVLWASER